MKFTTVVSFFAAAAIAAPAAPITDRGLLGSVGQTVSDAVADPTGMVEDTLDGAVNKVQEIAGDLTGGMLNGVLGGDDAEGGEGASNPIGDTLDTVKGMVDNTVGGLLSE